MSVTEIKSFLGLAGYYRRFVQDFSKFAGPLMGLMRKDEKFIWLTGCDVAFEELKHQLTTAPILTIQDGSR